MSRIKEYKKKVWVDGRNREHNIKEMSDEYIINCICFMQRRMETLVASADEVMINHLGKESEFEWMQEQVTDAQKSIIMFHREMYRRKKKGITIERADGCEEAGRF